MKKSQDPAPHIIPALKTVLSVELISSIKHKIARRFDQKLTNWALPEEKYAQKQSEPKQIQKQPSQPSQALVLKRQPKPQDKTRLKIWQQLALVQGKPQAPQMTKTRRKIEKMRSEGKVKYPAQPLTYRHYRFKKIQRPKQRSMKI